MSLGRGLREACLALAVAAVSLLLLGAFENAPWLRGLETASFDLRFRVRGVRAPGPDVVVVLADDRSLAALGPWPFSRRLLAKAVGALDAAGAAVVALDLILAEPEQRVPAELREAARAAARALPDADGTLRATLRRLAEDDSDAELAEAIGRAGKVLLPIAFSFDGAPEPGPPALADSAYAGFEPSPLEPVFPLRPTRATLPIPGLAQAAAGLGHVNWAYDRDGAPRYDYLALPFEADFLPSLPVRVVAQFRGLAWPQARLALGEGVRLGREEIPSDRAMRLLVNYRGPRGTFPTFSFVDLLEGRVPPAAVRGKIVLLGASFVGFSDSFGSPFGSTQLPGTERMANIVDTILTRDFIAENSPLWAPVAAVALLVLAALAGAAAALLPTRVAAVAGAAPMAAWAGAAQFAFVEGVWIPVVAPLATLALATLTVLLFRYWTVDREGRLIRAAFRHYMAPAMVDLLAAHPERLRLGGETRRMTVLFCDVRGFTSISEAFKANPQLLTRLINRFLTPMTEIIMARRGTIDKYMGDCIMAFWNAPLDDPEHARHACEAALEMTRALVPLNDRLREEAARDGRDFRPLAIGIGLNTGDCVVGNMGSEQRFDYSVLGDAVNLASRLEGQSKTYGVDIVIGAATCAAAPDFAALELDAIAVKGKAEAAQIYALLGDAELAASAGFATLAARHDAMLAAYRAQRWEDARALLHEGRALEPRLGRLFDLYEERIRHFIDDPPGADWNGVFVATTK